MLLLLLKEIKSTQFHSHWHNNHDDLLFFMARGEGRKGFFGNWNLSDIIYQTGKGQKGFLINVEDKITKNFIFTGHSQNQIVDRPSGVRFLN